MLKIGSPIVIELPQLTGCPTGDLSLLSGRFFLKVTPRGSEYLKGDKEEGFVVSVRLAVAGEWRFWMYLSRRGQSTRSWLRMEEKQSHSFRTGQCSLTNGMHALSKKSLKTEMSLRQLPSIQKKREYLLSTTNSLRQQSKAFWMRWLVYGPDDRRIGSKGEGRGWQVMSNQVFAGLGRRLTVR